MREIVEVKQGLLRGILENDCMVFKGIPYATPPVGDRRFRAPEPCECWEGIREADHFGKCSWQAKLEKDSFYDVEFYQHPDFMAEWDEDCLYLNIWTTKEAPEKPMPVAFWIHGGGFEHGFSHESEFDGAEYVKRGVVMVSINYRVGALGFLTHPWLNEENTGGYSGNYGIMDQIAALTWVKENIAAFGGDPENITIFGQSAGSISVQTLISSPLAKDMVSRAIMQSAGGYQGKLMRNVTQKQSEKNGIDFVNFCGIQSLEELRSADPAFLLEKQNAFLENYTGGGLAFLPVIDGWILPDDYNAIIERNELPDIPYMIGATYNDLLSDPEELKQGKHGPIYEGCVKFGEKLSSLGRENVYVYEFCRQLPGDQSGAWHSSELWYMFGTWKRCWRPFTEEDKKLSREMLDAWTSFMKEGCPGENWKSFMQDKPFVKYFDVVE